MWKKIKKAKAKDYTRLIGLRNAVERHDSFINGMPELAARYLMRYLRKPIPVNLKLNMVSYRYHRRIWFALSDEGTLYYQTKWGEWSEYPQQDNPPVQLRSFA